MNPEDEKTKQPDDEPIPYEYDDRYYSGLIDE